MTGTTAPDWDETTTDERHGERLLAQRRVTHPRTAMIVDGVRSLPGWAGRRPVTAAVTVVAVVFVLTTMLGGVLLGPGVARLAGAGDVLADEAGGLGTDVVGVAAVAVVLTRLGLWRQVGFGGPSTWTSARLLIAPAVFCVAVLLLGVGDADLDPARLALALPQPFLTGFWEEGLVRGVLLYLLLVAGVRAGRSPLWSVLTASVIFGALHLVALLGGTDPGAVLTQVCYATLIGIGFGAVLLRTNALWALVLLHAVFNLGSALGEPGGGHGFQLVAVAINAPLALYGLFLLRRVKSEVPGVPTP